MHRFGLLLVCCLGCSRAGQPPASDADVPAADAAAEVAGPDADAGTDAAAEPDADAASAPDVACPGAARSPCTSNFDCPSGYCVESPQGKVCTGNCAIGCGCLENWKCGRAGACVPKNTTLCKPCQDHKDCANAGQLPEANLCVPFASGAGFVNGAFCGAVCSATLACDEGYTCKEAQVPGSAQPVSVCLPDSGDCSCTEAWVSLQLSTACSRSNEFGTCSHDRMCTEAGLTLCNVGWPAAEVCDGVDNDCDGTTDEADAKGCASYFYDLDGDGFGVAAKTACLCKSTAAEVAGDCDDADSYVHPKADEVCNGKDDNCNGSTDEAKAGGCMMYYIDVDKDTYGDTATGECLCAPTKTNISSDPGDCDDHNAKIHPNGNEVCDGIDNDSMG